MLRLDKYLCDSGFGTRTEVKKLIKSGTVFVDGSVSKDPNQKIDEKKSEVCVNGRAVSFSEFHYILLHKPVGVVTANRDRSEKTVLDLIADENLRNMSPVGRLDKDTTGLLLLTDDGELSHRLLSPTKHVVKTYEAVIDHPLSVDERLSLETGVDIGDEKKTMPARCEILDADKISLSIMEGRFHQVKRMLEAVGNKVLELKRVRMGTLYLDEDLKPGEYRYLTSDEIDGLKSSGLSAMKAFLRNNCKACIFDMDGTLVDSMWMWKAIDKEYLGRFHIPLPDNLQKNIEGMSFSETAVWFKQTFHIQDSCEKMMQDWNEMAWDKYTNEVPLKEGVLEFLRECRDRGIKMGIATSNSRELTEQIIKVHGLEPYIAAFRTGSEIKKGKPAPDIYLAVMKELGVSPEECLVFEDIPAGILAGKNANMKTCAVMDAYSLHLDREKKLLADFYLDDFGDLIKFSLINP